MQNVVEFKKAEPLKLQWSTIIAVTIFHVLAVVALLNFSWANLAAAVVLWWVAGSLGIGLGYHRLLTHRGFKTPKWLEYFLTVCGTLALQSGAISWVTTHRLHHAFTETDKDPHSPTKGLYWAHIGWIFQGTAQIQSEATMQRYSPDLMKDSFHRFMNKWYWMPLVLVGVALFAIGGWTMVLWGVFLRTVFGWHSTWLVNSATHTWGTRRFDSRDTSTNNGLIAALTWGEGWHNNHHAFPRSAKHGLTRKEIDINWMQIRLLEKLGLATDVYAFDLKEYEQKEAEENKILQKAA
jgi:sn-1 stearoyl-lipid 9-desaturase